MASFRNTAWRLSPARLRTTVAAKLVYSLIGVPLDAIAEAADQATKARFPEIAPEDALLPLGRDRGILRGPLEPSASYRLRLLLWIEAWRRAGMASAILDQIAGYISPSVARMRIWTQRGVVYTRATDGELTIDRVGDMVWNWNDEPDSWARFWVIIYSIDGVPWTRSPVWGAGPAWGADPTVSRGSSALVTDVQSIRSIVNEWKPAAARCENIMVSFDATAFEPGDTSPPLPDGTWEHYWNSATLSANRDTRAIYWKGV
jgi:hypothetical protein